MRPLALVGALASALTLGLCVAAANVAGFILCSVAGALCAWSFSL